MPTKNEELKKIFKYKIKDIQIVYRKVRKSIKEWLTNSAVHSSDLRNKNIYAF